MKKHQIKKYLGFTLVELIIVITILAILATIAFVSFQNYTSQTRDTKRVSDLTQISKGLDIFQVTSGTLPTPDSPKTLTGGNSTLLVGKINSKVLSNLGGEVFDPSTKTEYTYATIGNGKYYQIGADSENLVTSVFQNTFADAKSSIVKGNYLFDPSLPSLIISSGSSLYDPNNCFVINGGTNLVSNNANCTPKSSTSLKNFDSSLYLYYDMESSSNGTNILKDLSGNNNNGTFNGTINASITGGILGNGLIFNQSSINQITGPTFSFDSTKNYTFNFVLKTFTPGLYSPGAINTKTQCYLNINYWNWNSFRLCQSPRTSIHGANSTIGANMLYNPVFTNNYTYLAIVLSNGNFKTYVNGTLVKENKNIVYSSFTGPLFVGNNSYTNSRQTPWNGIIDEVKVYNRALSDDEVLQQAKSVGL